MDDYNKKKTKKEIKKGSYPLYKTGHRICNCKFCQDYDSEWNERISNDDRETN